MIAEIPEENKISDHETGEASRILVVYFSRTGELPDRSQYETDFIGYPMWWYTFPMILYTLFDELDFSGRRSSGSTHI